MDLDKLRSLRPRSAKPTQDRSGHLMAFSKAADSNSITHEILAMNFGLNLLLAVRSGHVRFRAVETQTKPCLARPHGTLLGYTLGWH